MARFTISDCMESITNRYELTLAAAIRARQMEHGEETLLSNHENDKPTVLALREIADGYTDKIALRNIG